MFWKRGGSDSRPLDKEKSTEEGLDTEKQPLQEGHKTENAGSDVSNPR